jgi:hypothetical protein
VTQAWREKTMHILDTADDELVLAIVLVILVYHAIVSHQPIVAYIHEQRMVSHRQKLLRIHRDAHAFGLLGYASPTLEVD